MGFGIRLKVSGDYACFSRPELKVERVSYDMITPSAARGILDSIMWHKGITWKIDKIHVMKPIRFMNIRRNETKEVISLRKVEAAMQSGERLAIETNGEHRDQRAAMVLKDVEYILEAHFELDMSKANKEDTPEKFYCMALRRMRNGQYHSAPFLGTREFGAAFEFIEDDVELPKSSLTGEMDLGYMLYDLNYKENSEHTKLTVNPSFFRAKLVDGVLCVPEKNEVVS
ncbi:MAG: type I-C CRISPR-associated protein Cas5c [Christensenella sp.]